MQRPTESGGDRGFGGRRARGEAWESGVEFAERVGGRGLSPDGGGQQDEPEEHDFPAAEASLSLLFPETAVASLVAALRTAEGTTQKAKDLLRAANLTITEICFLVGFESVGSFSSRFRDLVGMSPTEYRSASAGAPPIPGCFVLMWTRPALARTQQSGRSTDGRSTVASEP